MSEDKTIIVIDDSPSIRETFAFLLKRQGFDVHTAVNGKEGLEAVHRLHPKAVLLDAMMPEMDGFEVCRRLKSDPSVATTTVIMLTAMGQKVDETRAQEAGVDAFLTKPPDIEKTIALLNEACSSQGGGATAKG